MRGPGLAVIGSGFGCVQTGGGNPEQSALVFPGDGESDLIREALRGQFERMPIAQDGRDDVGREKPEPEDAGEVGPAGAGLGGEVRHRLSAMAHHHCMIMMRLNENPAQAVVALAARPIGCIIINPDEPASR